MSLTDQPETDPIQVRVWADGPHKPFLEFLNRLAAINAPAAIQLVTYIEYVMEIGELALSSSLGVEGSSLRFVHAGDAWLVYFTKPKQMFICEQGFEDEPMGKLEVATTRMKEHQQTPLTYYYER